MGDPARYLPDCSLGDIERELVRIRFPRHQTAQKVNSTGAYHRIFRLTFTPDIYQEIVDKTEIRTRGSTHDENADNTSLILRVSGNHFPSIKTANEVGILTHLAAYTDVPVPQIIHYDSTPSNELKNEYMIMTMLSGQDGVELYSGLTESQMDHILDQMVTISMEMYKVPVFHIGGFKPRIDSHGALFPQPLRHVPVDPGPPLLETMWHTPDIDAHFDPATTGAAKQSFWTLNAVAPTGYPTYTSWLAAQTRIYMHAITVHPALHWVLDHDHDPALAALHTFADTLTTTSLDNPSARALQSRLNATPLKLTHHDLHFGNIFLRHDPSTDRHTVTGLLDWEFAACLPAPMWATGFLFAGVAPPPLPDGSLDWPAARARRDHLLARWREKVARVSGDEGVRMLRELAWEFPEQEMAWDVVNFLRCVVEVCPRGVQLDDARRWWGVIEKALKGLGIPVGVAGRD